MTTATSPGEPAYDKLWAVLSELDDSSSFAVSTKLKKAGIRGRPGSACHCPVANYVAKKLTGHEVSASLSFIRVWELSAFGSYDGRPLAECHTPDRIKDFIEAFDQGNYVDLQVN